MRLFLEFVYCCGSPTLRPPEPTPHAEEEASLVPLAPSRPSSRNKQGRLGRCQTLPNWRPSLGSIAEDSVVPQTAKGDPRKATVAAQKDVKRRSGGVAANAKAHHCSYSQNYGSAAMPMIMPTFSPTPFMF